LATLTIAEALLSARADTEGVATARSEVAAYYLNHGEFDKALLQHLEVDDLRRQNGAVESSDHTLTMLDVVYRMKREYDKAVREGENLIHPLVCSPPLGAATPTGRWNTEGMSISFRFPYMF
jgi:hypothetical protein